MPVALRALPGAFPLERAVGEQKKSLEKHQRDATLPESIVVVIRKSSPSAVPITNVNPTKDVLLIVSHKKRFHLRIGVFVDAFAATTKVQHRRRRDRELCCSAGHGAQERELLRRDALGALQFSGDLEPGRRELHDFGLALELHGQTAAHGYPFEALQEIGMEHRAAVLAIRDALESELFLHRDRAADALVFHRAKIVV